jgi:hypothetical protein
MKSQQLSNSFYLHGRPNLTGTNADDENLSPGEPLKLCVMQPNDSRYCVQQAVMEGDVLQLCKNIGFAVIPDGGTNGAKNWWAARIRNYERSSKTSYRRDKSASYPQKGRDCLYSGSFFIFFPLCESDIQVVHFVTGVCHRRESFRDDSLMRFSARTLSSIWFALIE